MKQLPIFLNLSGRTVVLVGEGEAADAKARLIARAGGRVVAAWEVGATLGFVALDDETAARAAADALRARGLLVNVVDRPDLCDFTTPAIVDRDPVTIAIGTGGASAGLAKAVRQRIEALLPSGLGALATALHAARGRMRARWPAAADRRRAIDAALAPGGGARSGKGRRGACGRWLACRRCAGPAIAHRNDPPRQRRPRRPHAPRRAPAWRGRSYLSCPGGARRDPRPRPRRCSASCCRRRSCRAATGPDAVVGDGGRPLRSYNRNSPASVVTQRPVSST